MSGVVRTIETRCVIAGGGPAGVMLGYLLARAGTDIVVLEKWPDFFRDFRGDTIHPSTMEVLHELGLLDDFFKLPHEKTRRLTVDIGGEAVTVTDFSRLSVRTPFIAFIPQWDFLNFIAEQGKRFKGFHLLMETEATDIVQEKGRVAGVRARDGAGELEIRAELVIGADGRHSTIREKAGLAVVTSGAPIDVLWFRLAAREGDPEQSFAAADHGKFLVMLDRGDYWQCGFLIAKDSFESIKGQGLGAFRETIAVLAPFLGPSVGELKDWDQVKLLGVMVDHLTRWYREGLLCIGDAAHAMSPLGGVGINLAIQDAVAAANVLIPAFETGEPTTADLEKIQHRRQWPTRMTQRLQIFMHNRVIIPYLRSHGHVTPPWTLRLFNRIPFLRWIPARIIGIGFRPEHIQWP